MAAPCDNLKCTLTYDSCSPVNSICLTRLYVYRTDLGVLDTTPSAILATERQFCDEQIESADIDHDGYDDLIVSRECYGNQIWIYRGGANFGKAGPAVIITDSNSLPSWQQRFSLKIADFDGDGRLDMVTFGRYADGDKIKFYWGNATSPMSWKLPDRVVTLVPPVRIGAGQAVASFDGDSICDIALHGENGITHLFLSNGRNKNPRTRLFNLGDVDRTFYSPSFIEPSVSGPMNDPAGRYSMLGLAKGNAGDAQYLGLSGGKTGPDAYYDTHYEDGIEEYFIGMKPCGDVDGDGWQDAAQGSPTWYSNLQFGIAAVFSGGPYIPRDPSLGVREIAVTGESRPSLFIWPQPMTGELHIAWRGDMKRMPARFAVYNLLGDLVAQGDAGEARGEVLWQASAGISAGVYLLYVYDGRGLPLAAARVVKR